MYDVYWLAGWLLIWCYVDQNTLSPGKVAEGSLWSRWWWWWVRTSQANHKSISQSFGVLRVSAKKPVYICKLMPLCEGRGSQFSSNTSHMIRKQTVNATLAMGHQADPAHRYKFHILQRACSTQYFTILFWDWGRQRIARFDSSTKQESLWWQCLVLSQNHSSGSAWY